MAGEGSLGMIGFSLAFMLWAAFSNSSFFTQAGLYVLIIGVSVSAGVVAGITIFGSGGDSSTTIIIFMETGLGTLWTVLTAGTVSYFSTLPTIDTIPVWGIIYSILSVNYIIGMLYAPRAIN